MLFQKTLSRYLSIFLILFSLFFTLNRTGAQANDVLLGVPTVPEKYAAFYNEAFESSDPSRLRRLYEQHLDKENWILSALSRNPNLPGDLSIKIAKRAASESSNFEDAVGSWRSYRYELAGNAGASGKALEIIAKIPVGAGQPIGSYSGPPHLKQQLARNPATPQALLKKFQKETDLEGLGLLPSLASNPSLNGEILEEIYRQSAKAKKIHRHSDAFFVVQAIVRHKRSPDALLVDIVRSALLGEQKKPIAWWLSLLRQEPVRNEEQAKMLEQESQHMRLNLLEQLSSRESIPPALLRILRETNWHFPDESHRAKVKSLQREFGLTTH